jgi:hypothetical protein
MLTVPFSLLCVLMFPLLFALAGCEESAYWSKPGATTADLRRDLADCERVATGPTPFHFWALGLSYEAARNRIAERKAICMNERGWVPTAEPSAPSDPSREST